MSDSPEKPAIPPLTAAEAAWAADSLGDGEAGVFPFASALTGRTVDVILLAEDVADELADLLGRFGDALTVRIFAAVTLADLSLAEIAAAIGVDEKAVSGQVERLESGGFLFHVDSGGTRLYAAGNPPLKRFFAKRFAPERRFHP